MWHRTENKMKREKKKPNERVKRLVLEWGAVRNKFTVILLLFRFLTKWLPLLVLSSHRVFNSHIYIFFIFNFYFQ